ncbi:hypothetical protein HYDPIDRAFT_132558 [Hydnomerulius pinastri MD-312]|uniref:Uncharacterized protein n=1 Tax=Hydnomerulius pinastri MD-312 TaxID=994086 RepID=A0A0C9W9R9_9AGAM|nr:hypothetical protein HYDPIDRAFT_132558 [Hydnomerulius pinastri MD-312]
MKLMHPQKVLCSRMWVLKLLTSGHSALVASPPQDLPSSKSVREEAVAESEYFPVRKDSADSATTGPSRAPASMPVPVGPRRAAPPRKKAYKSAPTASVSEPPSEEPQTESPPLPNITDKALVLSAEQLSLSPPAESLTAGDAQPEVGEVNKSADASYDEHLDIKHEDKEPEPETTVSTQKEHETIDETKDLEADEESGEAASRDVEEESMHTAADDENAPANEAPEVEEEEDEEARRKRVAAKLAQMGAFNPFAGPPVPRRDSADDDEPKAEEEEEPIAEDVTNVDAEEVAESHPSLPVARKDTAESIKHVEAETHVETQEDNSKVDEGEEAPANRDGES